MPIVFVAGLDDGTAPLCVLDQVVPVLIVLETKRRKEELHPSKRSRAQEAQGSSFASEQRKKQTFARTLQNPSPVRRKGRRPGPAR